MKDGGKNTPILRYEFYIDQNKQGLKQNILERGLWIDGMKKDDDLALLIQQDDLDQTKISSILDETVERLEAWLDFVPKYHLKIIFIEMYWGYYIRKVRTECDYEWKSLLVKVPEILDSVPLLFIRRLYTEC